MYFRLYLCRKLHKDKLLGEIKDAIDNILEGEYDRGYSHQFYDRFTPLTFGFPVVKRKLVVSKDSVALSEIGFAITIDTSGRSALDHKTMHAVSQAQEKAQHIHGLPAASSTAVSAIDTVNANQAQVVDNANALVITSLLSKIAAFNDFVKGIAEVGNQRVRYYLVKYTNDCITGSPIRSDGVEDPVSGK